MQLKSDSIRIRAQHAPWWDGVELVIYQGSAVAVNMTFYDHRPGEEVKPTTRISMEDAQTLMDDLWRSGLRPTEGAGSAGSLAATQRHLDDMRSLVFKKPPKD